MKNNLINVKLMSILFLVLIVGCLAIFDKQELKVGKFYHVQINSICKEISIPVNFKKSIIKISQISSNINKLLITDSQIVTCSDKDIQNCCLNNSTTCVVSNMFNSNSSSFEHSMNFCVESLFLYVCIEESISLQGEMNIEVLTRNDQGCSTLEFAPYTECASLGLADCKDQVKCMSKCVYADCMKEDEINPILSFCLPTNSSDRIIKEKCLNHVAFREYPPKIVKYSCKSGNENEIGPKKQSTNSFLKLLAILLGLSILLTIIASMYYRYKISIENTPPFDPPSFCPEILFPRSI